MKIKMRVLRHRQTGMSRIIGIYGSSGYFFTLRECKDDYNRIKKNAIRIERNEILSDITGTSARQARLDMGLSY